MKTRELFGVDPNLTGADVEAIKGFLRKVWLSQILVLPGKAQDGAPARLEDAHLRSLRFDLELLHFWFDPTASGKRVREALDRVVEQPQVPPVGLGQAIMEIGQGRYILTPEGRLYYWLLVNAQASRSSTAEYNSYLSDGVVLTGFRALHDVYRKWNQQRIRGVVDLLEGEVSTLRPTAMGLLLVLLINRNTSFDRRLPMPKDQTAAAEIGRAISGPALAFAQALSGSGASTTKGVDLYRGWALGEIARRLGSGLHREQEGIWIDELSIDAAENRLYESIRQRSEKLKARVPSAVIACTTEYRTQMPLLSGLGIAFERPSNTSRITQRLVLAAAESGLM